uniref:Uncharacterized protein n=1 Tax=Cebus imitator TaxID=2715852 RepID=A0A2K5RD32_CEBIM
DPNICAVFAVQGGKMERKHGIKGGKRLCMRSPAQQARGPWICESKHPAFAKQQANLEMPNFRVMADSTSRKKKWARSLTLSTAPLSPPPSFILFLPPLLSFSNLYNLAPVERTC